MRRNRQNYHPKPRKDIPRGPVSMFRPVDPPLRGEPLNGLAFQNASSARDDLPVSFSPLPQPLNQIPVRAPKIPQRPCHPSIRSVEAAVCEMWTLGGFRIRSGRAGTACPLLVISPLTPNIKKLSRQHLRRRRRPGSPMPSGESQRETASWPVPALPCSKQNRTHLQKPHYRHHHKLLHELIPFPCKPPSVFPTPCSCIAAQQLGLDPTTDGSDGGV